VKLDKPIIKLLWVFALVLLLNSLPKGALLPEAFAELSSNPTITVLLGEKDSYASGIDIDD
jgi:hypothetical protein